MPCSALEELREQARKITRELKDRRAVAKSRADQERNGRPANKNDYDWYLQRRLAKTAAAIEQHLAQHGCQR